MMDIKLVISADNSALEFSRNLAGLFKEGVELTTEHVAVEVEPQVTKAQEEKSVIVGTEPMGEFTTQDVKMDTAPVDAPEVDDEEGLDDTSLRKKIKEEAIRVVKLKKRDELKTLNAEFGISKVDELPSDQLNDYLEKVSSL